MYVKNIKADIALTKQLSSTLTERLEGKYSDDFPYALAEIEWEGKYLLLETSPVELGNSRANIRYNKALNEKLNTHRFFPGNDINGLVWQQTGMLPERVSQNESPAGTYPKEEDIVTIIQNRVK